MLNTNPFGSEGSIPNVYGGYPLAALTGPNSLTDRYCVNVFDPATIVVDNAGGATVIATVLELVCVA